MKISTSKIKNNKSQQDQEDQEKQHSRKTNFLIGFIGTNRTGKSSEALNIVKKWKKNNPSGFVLSFDPQDVFDKVSDEFLYVQRSKKDKEILEKIESLKDNIDNGNLVILDDYRLIQKSSIESEWLVTLMNFRAKWNIDIIYITHNPRLVINYLTYFTTHYYIFYTKSKEGSFEDKIPDYELCQTASNFINSYVRYYGRGDYPNFPHMIVDTEEERLIARNVTKDSTVVLKKESVNKIFNKNK